MIQIKQSHGPALCSMLLKHDHHHRRRRLQHRQWDAPSLEWAGARSFDQLAIERREKKPP